MPRAHLLDSQTNELLAAVQNQGMAASEFQWDMHNGVQLRHTPSGFFFSFAYVSPEHHVHYSPGSAAVEQIVRQLGWSGVVYHFVNWLSSIRREQVPDLWAEVSSQRESLRPAVEPEGADQPFTETERRALERKLDQIFATIVEARQLSTDEAARLRAEFDELKQDLKTLKRGRWIKLAIGTLFGAALKYGLTNVDFTRVMQLLSDALRVLSHGTVSLP